MSVESAVALGSAWFAFWILAIVAYARYKGVDGETAANDFKAACDGVDCGNISRQYNNGTLGSLQVLRAGGKRRGRKTRRRHK
jgi:hypothetical protein